MIRSGAVAFCASALILLGIQARAEQFRVATYNVDLERDGPGLLLRDLTKDADPQIDAVLHVIAEANPDILCLQGFDWDHDGAALAAFSKRLKGKGATYPFALAFRPNSGMATDLDLDGDGRLGGPGDAQGFGAFSGQGGIAVLSRFPILHDDARDFSAILWKELPGALLPTYEDGRAYPSSEALDIQRLSNTGHWVVPIELPNGSILQLMTFQAGPPVFDGPEDRNGKRNHDEIVFWQAILDGKFGPTPTKFVLAGGANLDPSDSDGRSEAIRRLLSDNRFIDPAPSSSGAAAAPDQGHIGANESDTVEWEGPGRMRVDYVLPSSFWRVIGSGVFWPAPDEALHNTVLAASRHRLVWVDLALD